MLNDLPTAVTALGQVGAVCSDLIAIVATVQMSLRNRQPASFGRARISFAGVMLRDGASVLRPRRVAANAVPRQDRYTSRESTFTLVLYG